MNQCCFFPENLISWHFLRFQKFRQIQRTSALNLIFLLSKDKNESVIFTGKCNTDRICLIYKQKWPKSITTAFLSSYFGPSCFLFVGITLPRQEKEKCYGSNSYLLSNLQHIWSINDFCVAFSSENYGLDATQQWVKGLDTTGTITTNPVFKSDRPSRRSSDQGQ